MSRAQSGSVRDSLTTFLTTSPMHLRPAWSFERSSKRSGRAKNRSGHQPAQDLRPRTRSLIPRRSRPRRCGARLQTGGDRASSHE